MAISQDSEKSRYSDARLAEMVIDVAEAVQADAILCATETGALARQVHGRVSHRRIIAATTDAETYKTLVQLGLETIRLPFRAADRYHQVRHLVSVAFRAGKISLADLVVCAVGFDLHPQAGKLVVVTNVEPSIENLAVSDLVTLTDGIRPSVLEATVKVACKIGRAAQRGKRIGTIFMLGDSVKVLAGARQLIPNPYHGHDENLRKLTDPATHDALMELSKLDGAFVIRGDGFIQTAGVFLTSPPADIELPTGLGARHAAAAAVTKGTAATAVVVSATDGNVRIFSEGKLVLQIDPAVANSLVMLDE